MLKIKFSQGSTTWYEEAEATYSGIYSCFMSVGNPNNSSYVHFEVTDIDTYYVEGNFPLICQADEDDSFWFDIDQAQEEKIREIVDEIEKKGWLFSCQNKPFYPLTYAEV